MLATAGLVAAWAGAVPAAPARRAVALLAATGAAAETDLAALPLGRRDALLLGLRGTLFGDVLAARADCPACGERLELTLSAADLAPPPAPDATEAAFERDGLRVEVRAPDTDDLAAAGAAGSAAAARAVLLARCVRATAGDAAVPASSLPAEVVAEAARLMAELDPGADPRAGVGCPACGHEWEAGVDVPASVWDEVDRRVRVLLGDVHRLASAYGWTHDEVLALAPPVRRAYLELVP